MTDPEELTPPNPEREAIPFAGLEARRTQLLQELAAEQLLNDGEFPAGEPAPENPAPKRPWWEGLPTLDG